MSSALKNANLSWHLFIEHGCSMLEQSTFSWIYEHCLVGILDA